MKPKYILVLTIILIIIMSVSAYFVFINKPWAEKKPLSDAECAKFMDCKVSDVEFGRSKTTFTTSSGIYPVVGITKGSKDCGKRMAVVLLDDKGNAILEKAYNSPPIGQGGETGYGDYNPGKNLTAGSYVIECYYGDALSINFSIIVNA